MGLSIRLVQRKIANYLVFPLVIGFRDTLLTMRSCWIIVGFLSKHLGTFLEPQIVCWYVIFEMEHGAYFQMLHRKLWHFDKGPWQLYERIIKIGNFKYGPFSASGLAGSIPHTTLPPPPASRSTLIEQEILCSIYEPALWSQPKVFIRAWTIWLFSGWKGVSSPPKFQHQAKRHGLGASARDLVSALWTSPPFSPVPPKITPGKTGVSPWKAYQAFLKTTLTFPQHFQS